MVREPLYCPRLIGRHRELSVLAAAARRAAAGETAFAFVSGEAGAGKTRLAEELGAHLPRRMRMAFATCHEYAPSPLGPILDVVAALQPGRSRDEPPVPAASTGNDPADKRRLFEHVAASLRRAADAGPFVAIIDDAHSADTVTLELLQFLLVTLDRASILFAVAFRSDALTVQHALSALVARAQRARNVERIELDQLSPAEISELIDATLSKRLRLPDETLRDVRDRSEGNPLFAEEFLKSAADGVRAGTAASLPASLRGLLVDRLQRIEPEDMRLLEIAALLGRRFSAAFLARIASREPASLERLLRAAIDEHILVEDGGAPGWFRFRHALTRDTILDRILGIHARALHVSIAYELEREPQSDARTVELADHYWRAGAFAECAAYAEQAGDLAKARHAYAEAADYFERAIACGVADEPALIVLHEKAAAAYKSLGDPRKVLEHLDVALASHAARQDAPRIIMIELDRALAYRRTAQTERAFAALRNAQALSAHGDERLRFKSAVQLAQLHALAEDWDDVASHVVIAERGLPDAEPLDAVRFYHSRALLHLERGELDAWNADFERGATIARAHGDPTLIGYALASHGVGARKIGRLDIALTSLREAAETGRVFGVAYVFTFARLIYANVLYLAGNLAGARAEVIEVLAELNQSTTVQILIAQFGVALATVLRDDVLFRRCFVPRVLEDAFATAEPLQYAPIAAAVAEYFLANGDEGAAIALLERMLDALPEGSADSEALIAVAVCCSEAQVARSRLRFDRLRARGENPFVEACRGLFEAYAAARFGDRAATLRHARGAVTQFQRLGMPLLEAEAHELAGEHARSVALCESVGALRPPRRLGSPATKRSPATQLTAREREVVELALSGFSNAAIADELSLSERTVEAHLAAAYRKVGVKSRAELATALRRKP